MVLPRLVNRISNVNTNNYLENAPFLFDLDNKLVFDNNLWKKIEDKWIGIEIVKIFGVPLLEQNVKYNKDPFDDKLYWILYNLFNDWTSGNNWFHLIPNSISIEIPYNEIEILIEISDKIIFQSDKNIFQSDKIQSIYNILPETMSLLKNKMTGIEYFIKTQHTSTKKDFKPISVDTPYEAIMHILSSKECNRSLKKSNTKKYLLLSPWQEKISSDNEFRVFIIDNKIAGISQQNIFKVSIVMNFIWYNMAEQIYIAIIELYSNIKKSLSYEFHYDQCCLDIWIEQKDENIYAHLIEINGRGDWGPAGSSLYCWKYDPPNADNIELLIRI